MLQRIPEPVHELVRQIHANFKFHFLDCLIQSIASTGFAGMSALVIDNPYSIVIFDAVWPRLVPPLVMNKASRKSPAATNILSTLTTNIVSRLSGVDGIAVGDEDDIIAELFPGIYQELAQLMSQGRYHRKRTETKSSSC